MVYVYAKHSELNKHIGKELSIEEVKETLKELGMDLKGESQEADPELKIEITAEKMDMISTLGCARAIKYYRGYETKLPNYSISKSPYQVLVTSNVEQVRPKTVAALLTDVPMTQELLDELIKIQEKIHDSFGRHRKKAAIGIYPADKISFPITYTAKKPEDISFQPLESETHLTGKEILEHHDTGKKFKHLLEGHSKFPIFIDAKNNILSMPPIINSHDTGRVETHHNTLFVEVSGHNLTHLDNILKTLVTTCIEFGAKAQSIEVIYPDKTIYELELHHRTETISLSYINSLIGINVTADEIKTLAPKMMYEVSEITDDIITVKIPCFKTDIWSDCDIADDIARAYGYNNIIPKFPQISTIAQEHNHTIFRNQLREQMVSLGFLETYTYMLTSTKEQCDKMDCPKIPHISIVDSAEEGINMARVWILPEILKALVINRKNKYPQHIFECGFTIQKDEAQETKAKDELHLAVAIADPSSNYTKIKEIIDTLATLNSWEITVHEMNHPSFIPGRCAEVKIQNQSVGMIGELHPKILENWNIIVPVSACEINLEKIFEMKNN
jgi:phenylalanyl-tRNA synthetase beta chain